MEAPVLKIGDGGGVKINTSGDWKMILLFFQMEMFIQNNI